jgi:hypothetical protein
VTKKETNLSGTLSEAVSVATSVAYTRQEIQKLKTELVSLLEKKTTEVIVEQVAGPVGPRGPIGATGAQGPKGDKGERGEKGEVGPQGNMGLDGLRGEKGEKGDKGEQGDIGPQGIAGERGPQGLKGDRGEDGKNGLDGKDGQAGAMGPVGPAGGQGLQGERGPKGDTGERGKDGQQGIQGPVGPAGPQGEIGPQGIQGVAGKDGKDGDIKPVEEKFQKFIDNVQRDVNSFKTKVNAAILKSGPNDAWKATGSGEVNLRYLDDVDRDSITDGYVLSYDASTSKFKFVEQSVPSGGVGTLQQVTIAGNTTTRGMTTSTLAFNLTSANTVTTGQMAWNAADLTVDIGMANGVTLQVGQEQYIKIKAGEAIADGEAVMFGGATGEHIIGLRNNMSATGYIPEWFIGVATQNFALNEFGYVTVFGKINGLNTLAYTAGDILYADPAVIGGLTKVEPQAPNLHIIVAAVTKRAGGDGHILVRPTFRPKLSNLSDVQITNIANNNLIKYNSANSRFENVSASSIIEPAYAQANSALSIAQSAFAQANTGGAAGTDNVARSIANSAFSTANSAFAKANTGTSQLVNGASTVSLSENGNLTVAGPIIGLGNSKLDFTTYGSNSVYLTTTSDDSTALFMGLVTAELYAHTTVQIRTNTAGVSKNWTFNTDGSTTLPGTVDITYTPDTATGSAITINAANTQGGTGYADFLKVTNTSGDATNPNKTFRLNSTGDLEIINSAYDANLFSLTNAGGLSVPGPISVGGKQAVNGPAFRAYVATGQAITSGSQQKVTFGTENFDTNDNFASSRFTPTIEGYYQLNATIRIDGTSSTGEVMIILYKNGSEYARGHNQSGTEQGASFYSMSVSDIAYANGSTDHFEVYIQQSSGGNRNTTAGSPISYFSGSMIRGA